MKAMVLIWFLKCTAWGLLALNTYLFVYLEFGKGTRGFGGGTGDGADGGGGGGGVPFLGAGGRIEEGKELKIKAESSPQGFEKT